METRIALMRGSGWIAGDLPGHLIVRSDDHQPTIKATQSDVLTLNPFDKMASLVRDDGSEDIYKLGLNGDLAFLPAETLGKRIPLIVTIARKGVLDIEDVESILKKYPIKEPFILAGHCGWFDREWCACPMGYRNNSASWLQFVSTGGASGLAFSPGEQTKGLPMAGLSSEAKESQVFAMLAEAVATKFIDLKNQTILLESDDPKYAAMLAVFRKALGPYDLRVFSVKTLSPPWKRFLEHLNAQRVDRPGAQNLNLCVAVESFHRIDWSRLMDQINRHSQVIPQSLFKH